MQLKLTINGEALGTCTAAKWRLMAGKLPWPWLNPGDKVTVTAGRRIIVDAEIGSGAHFSRVEAGPPRKVDDPLTTIRLFVSAAVRRGHLTRRLTIRPVGACFN